MVVKSVYSDFYIFDQNCLNWHAKISLKFRIQNGEPIFQVWGDGKKGGNQNFSKILGENQSLTMITFLDCFISHSPETKNFNSQQKPTFTGLLLNFISFAPFSHKVGLVKSLLDCAYIINSIESKLQIKIRFQDVTKESVLLHILKKDLRDLPTGFKDRKQRYWFNFGILY